MFAYLIFSCARTVFQLKWFEWSEEWQSSTRSRGLFALRAVLCLWTLHFFPFLYQILLIW